MIIKINEKALQDMGFDPVDVEAMRHFMRMVGKVMNSQTLPETVEIVDQLQMTGSARRVNLTGLEARLSALESTPMQSPNLSSLYTRLNELESNQQRTANLSSVEKRIEALEQGQQQRTNLSAVLQRLDNLENRFGA